ncbi:MAG: phage holin family protein [Burkholderiales bacterium]|nr:phage holin family protein [Burkholderiales bacterium]
MFGLQRIVATLLVAGRHRLELAALDVEEEVLRLGLLLAGMLAVAALATLSVAAAAALVVVAAWQAGPVAVLGGVLAVFLAATLFAWWRLRVALARKQPFLAGTLAELDSDARLLGPGP